MRILIEAGTSKRTTNATCVYKKRKSVLKHIPEEYDDVMWDEFIKKLEKVLRHFNFKRQ